MSDKTTNNKMKTKLKIVAASAIVATGCLMGISRFQTTECSAIALANVEALTDSRVVVEYDKCCAEDAEYLCILNYTGLIQGKSREC